jgi:hypothetical protein
MAKGKILVHLVLVAAAVEGLGQVAGFLEFVDDLGRRSFGDADGHGDISKAHIRVGGDAGEHVGVVGQEPKEEGIFFGA